MPDFLSHAWDALATLPHLGLALAAVWLLYLVLLGGWIVLQKREPVATLSWLLGLALLPYFGFLVYHFFGPQKIERQRLHRARIRSGLPEGPRPDDDEVAEISRMVERTTRLPMTSARDVRLLVDGAAKYAAMLEDIRQARHHIHLEYYIWHPDESGGRLRDALAERAAAGVQVRLLLDGVGAARARRFFSALLDAGGELVWFHPVRFGRFWRRPWTNLRTHRKIVVIDGCIAYTGGMNVSDDQNEAIRPDAYRDLHLRIEGSAVQSLQRVFFEDWAYATGGHDFIAGVVSRRPDCGPGTIRTQVLTSGPDSEWETIHRTYVGAIHAARRRVWMTTPYFVPGEAAMMALTSAALAGLDVRLMVPRMSDSLLVTLAARSYFGRLLVAGVKIHEYGPRMLHTKSLLIDDGLAFIGSANFDHRSFRLNFEVSLMFDDAGIAASLARMLEGELAQAPEVVRGRHRPLLGARLPESLARLLSPLL